MEIVSGQWRDIERGGLANVPGAPSVALKSWYDSALPQ